MWERLRTPADLRGPRDVQVVGILFTIKYIDNRAKFAKPERQQDGAGGSKRFGRTTCSPSTMAARPCAPSRRGSRWPRRASTWDGRLLTLRGDQFEPAYMKLNPNAVVPTLVHDGRVIIESTVVMHYVDEAFPGPALVPADPLARAKRAHDHQADGRIRAQFLHDPDVRDRQPRPFRAHEPGAIRGRARQVARSETLRDQAAVVRHGLEAPLVVDALRHHDTLLDRIEAACRTAPSLRDRGIRWRTRRRRLISGGSRSSSFRACGTSGRKSRPGTSASGRGRRSRPRSRTG